MTLIKLFQYCHSGRRKLEHCISFFCIYLLLFSCVLFFCVGGRLKTLTWFTSVLVP